MEPGLTMGMLAKSAVYGTVAGTAWILGFALPIFLDWRRELAERVEVVAFARDVAVGKRLEPEDLTTVQVAASVGDGSAETRRAACLGKTVSCPARAGAVVVRGCLETGER